MASFINTTVATPVYYDLGVSPITINGTANYTVNWNDISQAYGTPSYSIGGTTGAISSSHLYSNADYMRTGRRYDLKVNFPVLRNLATDNNVLNMPKLMKLVRERAAAALTLQLEPRVVELIKPVGIHDFQDSAAAINAMSTRITEPAPAINPDDIEQVSESMDNANGILTIHFRYYDNNPIMMKIDVSEDAIRHFDQESTMERMRSVMKKRMNPSIPAKDFAIKAMPMTALQAKEIKARETLRDMITESEWRRYLTNGYIMVKAPSGLHYQIFGKGDRTKVYKDNVVVESICIHTDSECPPSDHVINLKVLLEIDEEAVRKGGNIRKITEPRYTRDQMHAAMMNHIQGAADQGIVSHASVDSIRAKTRQEANLAALKSSSESLVSIYRKLKTA